MMAAKQNNPDILSFNQAKTVSLRVLAYVAFLAAGVSAMPNFCVDTPNYLYDTTLSYTTCQWVGEISPDLCKNEDVISNCPSVCKPECFCQNSATFLAGPEDFQNCDYVFQEAQELCGVLEEYPNTNPNDVYSNCRKSCDPTCFCVDDPAYTYDGESFQTCAFVASENIDLCDVDEVRINCPGTCDDICFCQNDPNYLANDNFENCDWVANEDTSERCALDGAFEACAFTCNDRCTESRPADPPSRSSDSSDDTDPPTKRPTKKPTRRPTTVPSTKRPTSRPTTKAPIRVGGFGSPSPVPLPTRAPRSSSSSSLSSKNSKSEKRR